MEPACRQASRYGLRLRLPRLGPTFGFRVNRFQIGALEYLLSPSFLAHFVEHAQGLTIMASGF